MNDVSESKTTEETNYFKDLLAVDISKDVEKKKNKKGTLVFSYLSWAHAVQYLKKRHPDASWEVKRFAGLPYLKTETGYFVEVEVTVEGHTLSELHPVLDHTNSALSSPNAFQINTSIKRCLAKAIALHGLGLSLYTGEDLPNDTPAYNSQPMNNPPKPPAYKVKVIATKDQISFIQKKITELGCKNKVNSMLDKMGLYRLEDLSKDQAEKLMTKLGTLEAPLNSPTNEPKFVGVS